MRDQVMEHILHKKIIAIVRKLPLEQLIELGQALVAGGIDLMEVTFDQSNPSNWQETCVGIQALRDHFKGSVHVGAGTVLTRGQAEMARDAGASYIISPNANADIIRLTRKMDLVSIPGCLTPTEIVGALDAGADFIKVFPAGVLGVDYIKAIRAPLNNARMLAVGGINEENATSFLQAGCVGIGVGGNLVNKAWIDDKLFDRITALANTYTQRVKA